MNRNPAITHGGGYRPGWTQPAPYAVAATRTEIEARMKLIRAAKVRKEAAGLDTDLTDQELDELLPPIPCLRTRRRLNKESRS